MDLLGELDDATTLLAVAFVETALVDAGVDALAVLDRDAWNAEEGVASFTTATMNQRAWRALMPQALWGIER